MNPHAERPISLLSLVQSMWRNRQLILQMTKREVHARYKGSAMGLLWSFLTPALMLGIYTFVFSGIFKARWDGSVDETKIQFAIVLFVGMIVHGLFSEVLTRAPGLILGNVNYVKKVIFPLDILPVVSIGVALFHSLISVIVLLAAFLIFNGYLHWTIIFIPVVLFPLIIMVLGLSWILASMGVFLRDVGQTIGVVVTVVLFSAPVFYPISALPEDFRSWLTINPLTLIIEESRAVLIFGKIPNWTGLSIYMIFSVLIAWIGYAWFQRSRNGFANVL